MKKTISLLIVGLGVIFSCKEKAKEAKTVSDSLSVATEIKEPEKENAQIINSTFDKIQQLTGAKNDTVYVTNYWATWCGPCVDEIPDFVALQNEYKDKKVKFIFVNVDAPEDQQSEVIPFVQKNKMKNVYRIPVEELIAKIGSINPELAEGIPVTIIQKGDRKEGFLGSQPKVTVDAKIKEYLK
ncbi:MAG: TlpA family protein disulfide reductase [Flavobacteriaceae bacterium]|jgi:thiol-disulfide isomerase/thioredoxin|nr:TlpA family protein disulfide reductase [Flavobacteriaceae bacterium]